MPDRPKWYTPAGARSFRATFADLDGEPLGTVFEVPVRLGDDEEPVTISVVKVSPTKWGVHTKAGIPARHLVGAQVKRRRRTTPTRPAAMAGREDVQRDDLPAGPVEVSTPSARTSFAAAAARMAGAHPPS